MSIEQWAAGHRADAANPLSVYTDAGYGVKLPSDYAVATDGQRVQVSRDVIGVLQQVFQGDYPLTEAYADAMAAGLSNGDVHLFTVHEGDARGPIAATAAIVRHHNHTTGELQSSELGRAGKLSSLTVSARALLRYRAAWAAEYLPGLDFLYSSLRSSQVARLQVPSGQAIQGVWLGEHRGPVMPVQAGFDYEAAGGIEPFTRVTLPMRPQAWSEAVRSVVTYVPDAEDKAKLETLVTEGTHGAVTPHVAVSLHGGDGDVAFHEVTPPNNKTHAKYVVSRNMRESGVTVDGDQLHKQVTEGISHKVVIEADTATTRHGAAVMARLRERGWTFVGWQESEQQPGALCPVMSHINPRRLAELVMPGHSRHQFDPGTRVVFNTMYVELLRNAALHPEARLHF